MIARSKIRSKERFPRRAAFTSAISLSILIRSQQKAKAKRKWNRWGRFLGSSPHGRGLTRHARYQLAGKKGVHAELSPGMT
jgi:hypothetical protein